MSYELYLRHYGRDGTLKNAVLSPLRVRFTDTVNGQGPLVFAFDIDHPQVGDLAEFDILEVMLRNRELGITDFTRAYVGILRDWDHQVDEDGLEIVEFTAPGQNHILSWRHILWWAGVNNRSVFSAVKAETVLKTVVDYNFTALAVHTPADTTTRQRAGDLGPGMGFTITTATDLARGNNVSVGFAGGNCLGSLQKVAEKAGGDFALTWQGENTATFDFEFYPGQLGADKSTGAERVLFALENNTLLVPRLVTSGARATVAISAGRDDGQDRAVTEVNGPDYAADYDIETFVDARNEVTAAGRTYRGAVELEGLRAKDTFTFDVLQTANQFYSPVAVTGRKTYKAGDLVAVSFGGERVLKIDSVRVEWAPPSRGDAFTVSITTREVP